MFSVGGMLCTVRTRAPEEVLHTSYTEVSTLKAGFLLEWGACLALHSGKFKMVFLTLHIPRSAITSHMTHLLCSYSAAGDGEHSGCVHKVHMTDIRVRDLGFTLNPWKNKYTACRLSLHVTVHVSPVSEKLNGHSMAPVFNVQDFASELVRGQFADHAPDDPNHGHKGADKLCAIYDILGSPPRTYLRTSSLASARSPFPYMDCCSSSAHACSVCFPLVRSYMYLANKWTLFDFFIIPIYV